MAESKTERRLRWLRQQVNANFTITCKGTQWRVDRGILAAESSYFERLCIGGFQETAEGYATFTEEEPEVIDQILVFLYTSGVYNDLAVISQAASDEHLSEQSLKTGSSVEQTRECLQHEAGLEWKSEAECCAIPRLETASEEEIAKVFATDILVYESALMMDLPELRDLVVRKFLEKEQYLTRATLADVLRTLFTHTEAEDSFRMKIIGRCIENYKVIALHPTAVEVLQEHEFSAWEWGVAYFKAGCEHKAEHGRLTSEVQQALSNLADVQLLYDSTVAGHLLTKDLLSSKESRVQQLEKDLAEVQQEFEAMPMHCTCGNSLSGSKWMKRRSGLDHLQYVCKHCSKKWAVSYVPRPQPGNA